MSIVRWAVKHKDNNHLYIGHLSVSIIDILSTEKISFILNKKIPSFGNVIKFS